MEEVKTKRGRIGFGQDKAIMSENYGNYFRNLYRELWKDGDKNSKLIMAMILFVLTYTFTMIASIIALLNTTQLIILLSTGVIFFGILWVVQRVRGFTTDIEIPYNSIESVKLVKGRKWLTCPRFIIRYIKDDKMRKRYISMHSYLIPGVEDRIELIKENFESEGIEVS